MEEKRPRTIAEIIQYDSTKPYWRHVYNVLSALRGPDEQLKGEDEELKKLTTARIRAVSGFFVPARDNFGMEVKHEPLNKEERDRRDLLLNKCGVHFRHHYRLATESLSALTGYDLGAERST